MVAARPLRRALLRDLLRLRGQVLATALVVACGVAAFTAMYGTYLALDAARDKYYADAHFADVFARLTRAPLDEARALGEIPGVAGVLARVAEDVVLDVPGLGEPAQGRMVGMPFPDDSLNAVRLRAGRLPEASGVLEAVASEPFAAANGLRPGDSLQAVVAGRLQRVDIVGVGISPEFIYEIAPGALFPDSRRFGVLWMQERVLRRATGMEGAFNDVAIALSPGVDAAGVIRDVDARLASYGGRGAYARDEQPSHRFIGDEIAQNRVMSTWLPAIFLAVGAFLLDVVLSRLTELQRAQIGVLRAFGYRAAEVAWHYAQHALATVSLGVVTGIAAGAWLGDGLVALYRDYYHFPALRYTLDARVVMLIAAGAVAVAIAGSVRAARRIARLAPADAMRPAAPPLYRRGSLSSAWARRLPTESRMILRSMSRRPFRVALHALGIACGLGLVLVGLYFDDALAALVRLQFEVIERQDVSVAFRDPRGPASAFELERLPGIERVELLRVEPARLRAAHRSRRVDVTGLAPDAVLRRLVDRRERGVPLPIEGLAISAKLAELLAVRQGEALTVEFTEGERRAVALPVAAIVDDYAGLAAYMDVGALARATGTADRAHGALLRADPAQLDALYHALKRVPGLAGVSLRDAALRSLREILARSFAITAAVNVLFACLIAFGLVYNGARVALSERAVELATLRVLGYTRGEAARLLLGEQGLLTIAAMPVGVAIGVALMAYLATRLSSELYRVPLVVTGRSVALAVAAIAAAAAISGALVALRVRALDPLTALKVRE